MQPLSSENHVFKVWGGSVFSLFRYFFWVWIRTSYFITFLSFWGAPGSPKGSQNPSKIEKIGGIRPQCSKGSPGGGPGYHFRLILEVFWSYFQGIFNVFWRYAGMCFSIYSLAVCKVFGRYLGGIWRSAHAKTPKTLRTFDLYSPWYCYRIAV